MQETKKTKPAIYKTLLETLTQDGALTSLNETIVILPRGAYSKNLKKVLCEVGAFNVTVTGIEYFCEKIAYTSNQMEALTNYSFLDKFYTTKKVLERNDLSTTIPTINEFYNFFESLDEEVELRKKLDRFKKKIVDDYNSLLEDRLTYSAVLSIAKEIYPGYRRTIKDQKVYYLYPQKYNIQELELLKIIGAQPIEASTQKNLSYVIFENPYEEVYSVLNQILESDFSKSAIIHGGQSQYLRLLDVFSQLFKVPKATEILNQKLLAKFISLDAFSFDTKSFIDCLPLFNNENSAKKIANELYKLGFTKCNIRSLISKSESTLSSDVLSEVEGLLNKLSNKPKSLNVWIKGTQEAAKLLNIEIEISDISIIDNQQKISKQEWLHFFSSMNKKNEVTSLEILDAATANCGEFENIFIVGCDANANFLTENNNILIDDLRDRTNFDFSCNNATYSYAKKTTLEEYNIPHVSLPELVNACEKKIDLEASTEAVSYENNESLIEATKAYMSSKEPREHLSASSISSALRCPLKFNLLTYTQEDPMWTDTMAKTDYGIMIHKALKEICDDNLDEEQSIELIKSQNRYKQELTKEKSKIILARFFKANTKLKKLIPKSESSYEKEFLVTINNIKFKGGFDRLEETSSAVYIFDYKVRDKAIPNKPLNRSLNLQILQNSVYALVAKEMFKKPIFHYYWDLMSIDQKFDFVEFDAEEEKKTWELVKLAQEINESGFSYPRENAYCNYCPLDTICPSDRNEIWNDNSENPIIKKIEELTKVDVWK
jgi:CRISPR/Cas system-associated exonuclease Cas4 (RecB family)